MSSMENSSTSEQGQYYSTYSVLYRLVDRLGFSSNFSYSTVRVNFPCLHIRTCFFRTCIFQLHNCIRFFHTCLFHPRYLIFPYLHCHTPPGMTFKGHSRWSAMSSFIRSPGLSIRDLHLFSHKIDETTLKVDQCHNWRRRRHNSIGHNHFLLGLVVCACAYRVSLRDIQRRIMACP